MHYIDLGVYAQERIIEIRRRIMVLVARQDARPRLTRAGVGSSTDTLFLHIYVKFNCGYNETTPVKIR